MDSQHYKKLKGRASFPFETVAAAIAFSPRMEALLQETKRIVDSLGARLILIHIGKKKDGEEQMMQDMIRQVGFDSDKVQVVWRDGDPVDTILDICKEQVVDLLIAGALQRENLLKFYLGSVARKLCRRAKCSLLILTRPSLMGTEFNRIVVNGLNHMKTIHTIETAAYFADKVGAKDLCVVDEVNPDKVKTVVEDDDSAEEAAKERKQLINQETRRIDDVIADLNVNVSVKLHQKCIMGKEGYTIGHYAESNKADLLVLNSPDGHLGLLDRMFQHDMEYILADIPSNLLIVHVRGEQG